ncbi:MAG TPA: hypothetical protein VHD61_08880 [Lacunisphaera sp.]|nr:hypothetical protein [Lacunisphaera sp.]
MASAAASPGPARRAIPGLRLVGWVLVWAALGWFYAWTPAAFRQPWLTEQPVGFYHELADGFLAGHLYLPRTPDPRLVALPDPYDPAANAPYRVNDVSYHAGRYYFYPSAVPALLLFVPVRALTGLHLSETVACWLFCLAGFAGGLAFLREFRRRCFPDGSRFVLLGAVLALALCQGYYLVLRVDSYNHVPIACAFAWLMLALWLVLRALAAADGSRARLGWTAAASLAYAIAIACRPNYVAGAGVLLVPWLAEWRAAHWRISRRLFAHVAVLGLPLGAVAAAMLAYNFARFDSPWEFGMRLQLGAWDQRAMAGPGLANVPANAWNYLLGPGAYHPTFPFVTAPSWTALGVIPHVPVVLFALLLPWLLCSPRLQVPARVALLLPFAAAAGNLAFLLLFPSGNPEVVRTSANARYLLDFLPATVLLAGCGVVAADGLAHPGRVRRSLLRGVLAASLLVSIAAALSLDFSRYPTEAYRPLARLLGRPFWWWERLRGIGYGPVALQVQLPLDRTGAYEPLLSIGRGPEGELLYLFYESRESLRLGLVDTASVGPQSESIAVDYAVPHRFEIHLGSLYPPSAHPLLAGLSDAQIAAVKHRLQVWLDGRVVFTAPAYFPSIAGGQVAFGQTDILRGYATERFSGRIIRAERLPVLPPPAGEIGSPAYGPLRVRLEFPAGRAGVTEPLVATGIHQAGDLLYVTYRADGAIRLGLDHWGRPGFVGDWFKPAPRADHVLEFSSGALYPPANHAWFAHRSLAERATLKERVRISFDGQTIADVALTAFDSSPEDVVLGRNAIGASTAVYAFTGRMLDRERLPPPGPRR